MAAAAASLFCWPEGLRFLSSSSRLRRWRTGGARFFRSLADRARTTRAWRAHEMRYWRRIYILGIWNTSYTEASIISRCPADSIMLRTTLRRTHLSLGTHREQLMHRTFLTCPRPFLFFPWLRRLTVMMRCVDMCPMYSALI